MLQFWENYAGVSYKSMSTNLTQIEDKFSWQVNLWFIVSKWHVIELTWREKWENNVLGIFPFKQDVTSTLNQDLMNCCIQSCSLLFSIKKEFSCHV